MTKPGACSCQDASSAGIIADTPCCTVAHVGERSASNWHGARPQQVIWGNTADWATLGEAEGLRCRQWRLFFRVRQTQQTASCRSRQHHRHGQHTSPHEMGLLILESARGAMFTSQRPQNGAQAHFSVFTTVPQMAEKKTSCNSEALHFGRRDALLRCATFPR